MRRTFAAVVTVAFFGFISCLVHAQALPENLISNPSFESSGGWSSWTYSGSAVVNYRDSR